MPGSAACIARLTVILREMTDEAKDVLDHWVDRVGDVSKWEYCPVDKGVLRNSYSKRVIKETDKDYVIRMSYATPYAVYVHEIPYHHKHGSWKYLTAPVKKKSPELKMMLEMQLAGVFR